MRGKKLASLILALVMVISSTMLVSAEGYTTIPRSTNIANDDYSHKEVSVATGTTDRATVTLQVKREEDTFDVYNLVTITPETTTAGEITSITNLDVQWVDAIADFIDANTTTFPLSQYGEPKLLGYEIVTGNLTNAQKTAIEKSNSEKEAKLIKLLNAVRQDSTTMAALSKTAILDIESIAEEDDGVWVFDSEKVAAANLTTAGLNSISPANGVKISANQAYAGDHYTFSSLAYEISGLPFGLYFFDASNDNRTDNGGYQPVVYNLIPEQTGPSGHWYMDNTKVANLKYEGIHVEKQINGQDSDIVRAGEIVTFRVEIDIPEYVKKADGNYQYDTFSAFDDMSNGYTLIASSSRITYFDASGKEYHRDANFIPGGNGNVSANDKDKNNKTTYEAYLNGVSIPFYSTTVGEDTVYFYATPTTDDGTVANIWAVVNGVLTQIKTNVTIATLSEGVLTYGLTKDALTAINQNLPDDKSMSSTDVNTPSNIAPLTYTDVEGNTQVIKKSTIGIIFNYKNLMDTSVYAGTGYEDEDKESGFTYPDKFVVTYDAIVNETAYVGTSDNTNKVLVYYVTDTTGNIGHADDEVVAWTYGANIVKVDGENYDAYVALEDDDAKEAFLADTNTPVYIKDATFNIYRLDTTYCGGANATTAPLTSDYSTYAYYSDSDTDYQTANISGKTITRDSTGAITANARYTQAINDYVGKGGLLQKAVQYELTQKGGITDKAVITATNTGVGAVMKTAAFNHDFATADKFTNKYNFAALYTTDFATVFAGQITGIDKAVNLGNLKTTKGINILTDYMLPMIKTDTLGAPDYTASADFSDTSKANTFVMYLPVEVNSCETCNTKHYHLEAYSLFYRDAVSNNTAAGIKIKGLDPNKYLLVETKAPNGYNELTSALAFEVNKYDISGDGVYTGFRSDIDETTKTATDYTDGYYPFTVKNFKGLTLPSTGGMGTLLFTIIGIIIMISAIMFVLLRNRKVAKNAAAFMMMALVVIALVGSNALTAQAVTTINLDSTGAASGGNATKITDANGNCKLTVKVASESDKLELYRITDIMEMENGVFKDVKWSTKVLNLMSSFETDYPNETFLATPDAFSNATPDQQSLFLQYIDKNKESVHITEDVIPESMISIAKGGDENWYATITGTNAKPLNYGIYLVKGTTGTGSSMKNYQLLTINAVPVVKGPLGGYYLSDDALNVTLKYQDLLVTKTINEKAYDYVRVGETVAFEINGEVPAYLPISEDGQVLTAADGDAYTNYDYSKYKYVMTDDMSDAFTFADDFDPSTDVTVKVSTDGTEYTTLASGKYRILFTEYQGTTTENVGLIVFNDTSDTNGRYKLVGDVSAATTNYNIAWYLFDTKAKSFEYISTSSNVAAGALTSNTTVGALATSFKTKTAAYRTEQGLESVTPTFSKVTSADELAKVPTKSITFDYKYLKDQGYTKVRVSYNAIVTEKCLTGVSTNTNTASFWYRKDVAGNYDPATSTVRAYTFGLNVLKSDGDSGDYLAGAEFALYKEAYIFVPSAITVVDAPADADDYENYIFGKAAANDEFKNATEAELKTELSVEDTLTAADLASSYYFRYEALTAKGADCKSTCKDGDHVHIHAYKEVELEAATRDDDETMVDDNHRIVSIDDATGSSISGLEPASYVLIETKAPTAADGTDYNILTEAMRFEITAMDKDILGVTENADLIKVDEELALAGFVSNIQVEKSSETTDLVYMTKTVESTPQAIVKGFAVNKYYQGYPNGVYKINVKNFKGLTLPSTGGVGTLLFTIIGIIMMISVIITVLIKQRRRENM